MAAAALVRPGPVLPRRLLPCLAAVLLALPVRAADPPSWWIRRGVLVTNAAPNDFAAANGGQAKWLATQARAEFDEMLAGLGGAGDAVADRVTEFTPSESDFAPVNVGQVKNLVRPFYDRLAEAASKEPGVTHALPAGMSGVYPWSEAPGDDVDFALANAGQLKFAFSFDFDRDRNGMADWWERRHFGAAGGDAARDSDGDGLPDGLEHTLHSDPTRPDTDGDGIADGLEVVVDDTSPVHADTDGDGLSDGDEVLRLGTSAHIANPVHDLGREDIAVQTRHVESHRSKTIAFPGFATNGLPPFYLRQTSWGRHTVRIDEVPEFGWPGFSESEATGQVEVALDPVTARRRGSESFWSTNRVCPSGTGDPVTNYTGSLGSAAWANDGSCDCYWGAATNVYEATGTPPWTEMSVWEGSPGRPWPDSAVYDEGGGTEPGFARTASEEDLDVSWSIDVEDERSVRRVRHRLRRRNSELFGTPLLVRLATNDLARDDPWGENGPEWGMGWRYDERGEWSAGFGAAAASTLDVSEEEVECDALALQYRVCTPSSVEGVVYRASVLHFFTPKGATHARVVAHTNYLAVGTGGPLVLNPDGSGLPVPTEQGTNWISIVRARLAPDFNRDGVIDDTDRQMLEQRGGFRIWINDDRDIGDDSHEAYDDAPRHSYDPKLMPDDVAARPMNCMDSQVNGLRDLVDFFPVHLDFPFDEFPPGEYTYALKQEDSAVKYVYTSLRPDDVRRIHTSIVDDGGAGSDVRLDAAPSYWPGDPPPWAPVSKSGHHPPHGPLDPEWIASHRVLLIEGAAPTKAPLVFEVRRGADVVLSCSMALSVSPVRDMFRYLNVRTNDVLFTRPDQTLWTPFRRDGATVGRWPTSLAEPANYPDGLANDPGEPLRTLVAIHGVDWDHSESPAGFAEIFKRFFQSGCKARYVGVSWAADCGRRIGLPMVYYTDVIGAFVSAHCVKEGLRDFWGPDTTVLAHSLGNVLASSMIVDHGASVGNYFLLNAAVPIEAYDGAPPLADAVKMIPPGWKEELEGSPCNKYAWTNMAARWHALFSPDDPRSRVGWDDRFAALAGRTNVYNFFSSQEDVLKQPNGTIPDLGLALSLLVDALNKLLPSWAEIRRARDTLRDTEYTWVYSEMTKGDPAWITALAFLRHVHGGWGFRDLLHDTRFPVSHPIFTRFEEIDERCPTWDHGEWLYAPNGAREVQDKLPHASLVPAPGDAEGMNKIKNHAKLLAEAIPSLSGPTGGSQLRQIASFDLNQVCREPMFWPTRIDQRDKRSRWLHGDYKSPAYPYVHRLYDRCTRLIQGATP